MTFRQKIDALRKGASEAQSASKIIDKLKALKDSNSPETSYRWVWELIQNAKDVVNTGGSVDIQITFSEVGKSIEFSHNGRLFTTENIVFLIEQVSSKERSLTAENKKKTTGKFGTGFLTTHLLSEKVQVHGYLQDEGEKPRSFQTLLDRTGQDKAAIMAAIGNSCEMLDNGQECDVDEKQMNTKFIYELNDVGIKTAIAGLRNLLISIPYVFAFVAELNSITVIADNFHRVISRGSGVAVELDSANVTHVHVKTNQAEKETTDDRYVFVLSNDLISIATEIKTKGSDKYLIRPHDELPHIFCDFPLLGTNDFSFPIVVNSPMFNPTEPRDGIPLVQSNREGGDSDENCTMISGAIGLYNSMLDYFVKKGYKDLFNMVRIIEQPEKYWIDAEWIEKELIEPIKEHIKTTPLIKNKLGNVCSLYDDWGTPNIFIMKDETQDLRSKAWGLSSKLIPNMMSQSDEIEQWYNSLWIDCRNFNLIDLIQKVEEYDNIDELGNHLDGDAISWLNELIEMFYHSSGTYNIKLGRHPSILPNQRGDFRPLDKIFAEINIGETYKDIALLADIDFRERLLDSRISKKYLFGLQDLGLSNVFYELNHARMDYETSVEFYKNIINLQARKNERQNEFLYVARSLYPEMFNQPIRVASHSDKLLSDALKFWRDKTCKDFSAFGNVSAIIESYDFQDQKGVAEWISKLASCLKNSEDEGLLDKYPVLPNQHGVFMRKSEIFLDDSSVNEILKDAAMYSDNDVRQKMLLHGVVLELPPNRVISLESIAPSITAYVRTNNKSISKQGLEVWETFRNTSIWIRDNRKDSRVSKCFKELIENFHWFYDDEEIAESMAKSEQYDEVLKKYNVSDINELVSILASHSVVSAKEGESISISKELLAQ